MLSLMSLKRILLLTHLMIDKNLKRMILLIPHLLRIPHFLLLLRESIYKPVTPLPPFPHRLEKKDKLNVDKIRETFSQVKKINILLLDVIQRRLLMLSF